MRRKTKLNKPAAWLKRRGRVLRDKRYYAALITEGSRLLHAI